MAMRITIAMRLPLNWVDMSTSLNNLHSRSTGNYRETLFPNGTSDPIE